MRAADVAESSPKLGARAALRILVERCHIEQCEPEIGHTLQQTLELRQLNAASILQASAFRGDATRFRLAAAA